MIPDTPIPPTRIQELEHLVSNLRRDLALSQRENGTLQRLMTDSENRGVRKADAEIAALRSKLDAYESAMERERKPEWEKWNKDLAEKLRDLAPELDSPQDMHDLLSAARQLDDFTNSFTLKANFVPSDLCIKEAYDIIDRIRHFYRMDMRQNLVERVQKWLTETKAAQKDSTVPI